MRLRERFERDGFLGPEAVLTNAQCALLVRHEAAGSYPPPLDWNKGRAATDAIFADVARTPALLRLLRPLLGDDVVLWGASIVRRGPNDVHTWHTDIETSDPDGRFVSVWIGLENTARESGLTLVAGSHRQPRTIQEELHRRGLRRGDVDDDHILAIAREIDPEARLAQPPVADGLAILFHGRMWHGTRNRRGGAPRSALLLQYAAAGTPVRILDSTRLDWPFAFLDTPRPPVLSVAGTADGSTNRVVPPPTRAVGTPPGQITQLTLPLALDEGARWTPHPIVSGRAPNIPSFTCHASALAPGHQPHLPHSHVEEEILVVLHGEAELVIASSEDDPSPTRHRAGPGDAAYYPAYQHHTIRNVGPGPLNYAMVKWAGPPAATDGTLTARFDTVPASASDATAPVSSVLVYEGPTQYLGKLHAHRTLVRPGGGYAAHADPHDIFIFVQSGRIRTQGREAGPGAVLFHPAGEVHGIANPGPEPAQYLVFEFHAPDPATIPALVDPEWYLARYPDVAAARLDPLAHYLRYGAKEGRLPRPPVATARAVVDFSLLDRDWYLEQNPDVAAAGMDPAEHYRIAGAAEGRQPCADYHLRLAERSGLFDAEWYRLRHPDAGEDARSSLLAYLTRPELWPRAISPQFSGGRYLADHPDVARHGINPLLHFVKHGRGERRQQPICADWGPTAGIAERIARYRARPAAGRRRIALCTAIIGRYDTLMVPDRPDPDVDYLCFADREIDGHGVWSLRAPPAHVEDPTRMARFIKTHLPQLAPDYDALVWIDGNVLLRGDLAPHIDRVTAAGWGMGLVAHPERDCIYVEGEACKALGVDDAATIDAQLDRYRAIGLPAAGGLWETNFLVLRPGEPGVRAALELWWGEIERHSRRDQLSIGLALTTSGTAHGSLFAPGLSVRNHPDFTYFTHQDCRWMTVPAALLPRETVAA